MAMDWDKTGAHSPKKVWTDREGVTHLIKNMDDNYLLNCIRYIKFYGGQLTQTEEKKLDELQVEYCKRHDLPILPWNEQFHNYDEIAELVKMHKANEERLMEMAQELNAEAASRGYSWRKILKDAGYKI